LDTFKSIDVGDDDDDVGGDEDIDVGNPEDLIEDHFSGERLGLGCFLIESQSFSLSYQVPQFAIVLKLYCDSSQKNCGIF